MKFLRRSLFALLIFALGLGAGAFGFRTYLGALSFDGVAPTGETLLRVDHSALQGILDRHLKTDTSDGIYRFDYRAAQSDRAALDAYLTGLQSIDPSILNADEALAYWLNFYNAGMIHLVLARGDYGSVIGDQPYYFLGRHFTVADQPLSLDQIEHQIIRVQWQDPRIHYALNCASLSCPNLQPMVFAGAALDAQLDAAARAYINHPRGVAGLEGRRLVVSEIFDWFQEDFGGTDRAVIDHIGRYADAALAADLADARRLRLQPYDWALNITAP